MKPYKILSNRHHLPSVITKLLTLQTYPEDLVHEKAAHAGQKLRHTSTLYEKKCIEVAEERKRNKETKNTERGGGGEIPESN